MTSPPVVAVERLESWSKCVDPWTLGDTEVAPDMPVSNRTRSMDGVTMAP